MKKVFALLLCLLMIVSLAACTKQEAAKPAAEEKKVEYPTKAITVIVPYQAGSQMDLVTRKFITGMEAVLGQPMAVENVVGADGATGHIQLAQAKADGYTIGCASASPLCVSPWMQDLPYTYESFEYIGLYQPYMHGVAANKDTGVTDLKGMVDWINSHDNTNIGYAGTVNLCNIHKIIKMSGVDANKVTIVPYNSNDVIPALAGGFLDFAVHSNSTIGPMHQSGEVMLIAPLGSRWEAAPDVPSSIEQGFEMYSFGGLSLATPKGVDPQILQILRDAFAKATENQEYSDMLISQGYTPLFLIGDECAERIKSDSESAKQTLTELGMAKQG